jgi:hypothetical protein
MKIHRNAPVFQPITIVLENEDEARNLLAVTRRVAGPLSRTQSLRDIAEYLGGILPCGQADRLVNDDSYVCFKE